MELFTKEERDQIYKIYEAQIEDFFDEIDWRVHLTYEETFDMTLRSIAKFKKEKQND